MVRFTVLASGSKGNSTVISCGQTKILVDCGLSCRELFRRMRLVGEEPEALDAILITHEHADHVNGVAVTARKLGIPVYFTEGTHRAWQRWLAPRKQMSYAEWMERMRREAAARQAEPAGEEGEPDDPTESETEAPAPPQVMQEEAPPAPPQVVAPKAELAPPQVAQEEAAPAPPQVAPKAQLAPPQVVEYFRAGEPFSIGEIAVSPFSTPHDAADPVGFVFTAEGVRMGYATDLGYLPPNVKAQLTGLDLLLLESNHDLEMLRDGPYPWAVKQRVLSRVGHLSNETAANFLESEYDGQAAYVILAHLSESNNLPELAKLAAERALHGRAGLAGNRLFLASQHEPLSSLYF
jgi:phosphoribosyl 1,2-cyclic phosphodiesterase